MTFTRGLRALGWWAALFVLLALRREHALSDPQFFGDDSIWFRDQLMLGWRAVLLPWAGYWQPAARLIAAISSLAPLSAAPLLYTLSSIAIAAACCGLFAAPHFRPLLPSDGLRVALCLIFAGAIFTDELVGTPTNVQWYILIVATLLLVCPPTGRWWAALGFFLAASNPILLIVVPLVLLPSLVHRRAPGPFQWGAFSGLALQVAIAFVSRAGGSAPLFLPDPGPLASGAALAWSYRVALPLLVGQPLVHPHLAVTSDWLVLPAIAAVIATVILGIGSSPVIRRQILGAAFLAVAGFVVPYALRGRLSDLLGPGLPIRDERYFVLPALATAYLVALGLERARGISASMKPMVLLAMFAFGFLGNLRIAAWDGAPWASQLPAVRAWIEANAAGRPAAPVVFEICPHPWRFVLPGTMSDPGFEGPKLSWLTLQPGARLTDQAAHQGAQSLWIGAESNLAYSEMRVSPGVRYTASVFAHPLCDQPGLLAALWVHDTREGHRASDGPRPLPCGQWTRLEAEFEGGDTELSRIHLQCWKCPTGVLWDDVGFEVKR